jgi:signal transduction histidine kinase/ActR/RegA family two-component response regulator
VQKATSRAAEGDYHVRQTMLPANRPLFAAAVGVPLLLLALAGWLNWRQAESQALHRAQQTTEALGEHALRTLRTHELIIDFVDRYVRGWTWEEIRASRELHLLLRHLTQSNRDIASIFLLDPQGRGWVSSRRFPMPAIDGSDRDYYQALLRADVLYISEPATSRVAQDRFFAVARRRSSDSGKFDGLIAVSVNPQYFESFYATLLETGQDAAGLARMDGVILVRHPQLPGGPAVIPPSATFMREMQEMRPAGSYVARSAGDRVKRVHAYRRVGDYPVFASYQLSVEAVWEAWWWAMLPYVIATLLAMALMMATIGLATQYARRTAAEARTEEAEQANRAKDLFLAALSHELRNPLAAISNASQALQREAGGEAGRRTAVEIIARQIALLRRMLDDLLDTARVVHGKLKIEKRRVDLRPIAASVAAEQLARRPGARIEVQAAGGEPWVNGDAVRLKQMLDNLVENAIKYGGRNIYVDIRLDGDWVQVAVTDDGQGIPRELLPRLFQPFVQGEQTLDRAQGGLGLGLALVQRLAVLHGGGLTGESEGPGRGSRFTLRLPRAEAPARAVERAPAGAAVGKRRLLVIDDEADARESLGALLRLEGHEVHAAADGAAGLALLAEVRPGIALVDIGLPGMDGYEVARRARALGGSLLLIAVTGYGQRQDRDRAHAAGFDAHLTKPFTYEELMRAVERSERRAAA